MKISDAAKYFMLVEKLYIEGFKAFQESCEIPLSKINLLFGAK